MTKFVISGLWCCFGFALLLIIQWLGWHGPDWIMLPLSAGSTELMLSPLIFVPLLFLAVAAFVMAFKILTAEDSL